MSDRAEIAAAARQHVRKVMRIIDLFEQGLSDAAIGEQLGWCRHTVLRYRRVLRLQSGNPNGRRRGLGQGRWRDAHAQMHEEAP